MSQESPPPAWHALASVESLQQLGSRPDGLSPAEAAERLGRHGANRLPPREGQSPWLRLALQFHNLLIYVLLVAALVTFALGEWLDSAVIAGVVVINALVGFIQEGKAEQAMRAIQKMLVQQSRVRRGGDLLLLPAEELVPGDVVLLEAGERVSADLRLLEARDLRIDEALLTGESLPADKQVAAVSAAASLGDRRSMAYSGTLVSSGSGVGVVVATAGDTELGRISHLLGAVGVIQTPLLSDMATFARRLTVIIVAFALLAFVVGVGWRGYAPGEMLMASVGIAVAAIPEGLPAVLTIILALGVQRMARRQAIIRRLPAVESLGAVTVICSDKTGTLTRNEMTVQRVYTAENRYQVEGVGYAPHGRVHCLDQPQLLVDQAADLQELARAGLLASQASLCLADERWCISGDPTEAALLTLAGKLGLELSHELGNLPRIDAIPFSAERRSCSSLHHDHGGHALVYLIGAPERLLEVCNRQWSAGRDQLLDVRHWHQCLAEGAGDGLRMLGLALRVLPQTPTQLAYADLEGEFVLLGLVGLLDPPREEVVASIRACHEAGIRVKMITGDHAATAACIARRLGLGEAAPLSGAELDQLDDAGLAMRLADTQVFARTTPAHKLRLVEALQAGGERVAMTGDGVNDAPALKRADIGVAMGIKGTEVAKEAAQMVLADDNFATLVHAVEEGRTVYDNLRKSILFILPTNGGQALILLLAIALGMTLPITPLQILWVNMVTAVTLALALAFEPAEEGLMRRPPRDPRQPLLDAAVLWRIALIAGLMSCLSLGLFAYSQTLGWELDVSRTLAVNVLVACEICYLFSSSRLNAPAHFGWRENPMVWGMVLLMLLLQVAFSHWSPLQRLFDTADLPWQAWLWCAMAALACCLLVELEKAVLRWRGTVRRGEDA